MKLCVCVLLFIVLVNKASSRRKRQRDPIASIVAIPPRQAHRGRKQKLRSNNVVNTGRVPTRANQSAPVTSQSSKRNAHQIVNASPLRGDRRVEGQAQASTTRSPSRDTEQCSYTFVVPRGSQHCAGSSPQQDHNLLIELNRQALATKAKIEEIRNEIEEEKQAFPSARELQSLQKSVDMLQKESRNMDSRVSQIYMQLLHEIINKRDNSLELQELRKNLLNRTVEYYMLKEDHEELKQNHNALRLQVSNQSEQLEGLRQQIESLLLGQSSNQTRESLPATSNPQRRSSKKQRNRSRTNTNTAEEKEERLSQPLTNFPSGPFRDCVQVQEAGYTRSGIFNLRLPGYHRKIRAWCDFDQDPGGWIVIQRRSGRRVNFYREMLSYKKGFGRPHSDYWLGLEKIHRLTNQTGVNYKLHIDMEDWDGRRTFVEYRSFRVGSEVTGYQLKVNHYSGTAGDSLTWHNNMRFTAKDRDRDVFGRNCATIHHGGWWYNSCAHSNLNGVYYRGGHYRNRYQDGVYWSDWRGGSYSLKSVSMKIRPTE